MTIRDIRSSIFALHTRRPFAESLRDDVTVIAREAARALGFEPAVSFEGPVDSVVTDRVREHLLATLREALSNVTKHAHASAVTIEVGVDGRRARAPRRRQRRRHRRPPAAATGCATCASAAIAFGGDCEIGESTGGGGTQIEWRVAVDANRAAD